MTTVTLMFYWSRCGLFGVGIAMWEKVCHKWWALGFQMFKPGSVQSSRLILQHHVCKKKVGNRKRETLSQTWAFEISKCTQMTFLLPHGHIAIQRRLSGSQSYPNHQVPLPVPYRLVSVSKCKNRRLVSKVLIVY